ncbi:flagellar filament capping protein FliD [Paraburkholderia fungorum]|uniref:flagellar filament capping protein FliD n=1 Tax=Paraburkholderia fungorum TaxID=134537 RepID=UPI0038BC60DE
MSSVSTTSAAAAAAAANSAALQQAAQSIISGSTGNSSLDVSSLVSALVSSKTAGQLSTLTAQTNADNLKISAIGTLKAALSALQTSLTNLSNGTTLASYTATASGSGLSATAGVGAVAGSYAISVQQIAQAQTISSGAFNATTQIGTGTLNVSLGGQSMAVNIDSTNNTLSGIAAAINSATNNPGVSATIVTGTDGAHLVLRSTSTGAANTISVSSTSAGLSSLGVTSSPAVASGTFNSSQELGSGAVTLSLGATSMTVNVTSPHDTLGDIAAAINGDSTNPGITAKVVTTSSGSQLVLSPTNGSTSAITVSVGSVTGDSGLSSLANLTASSSVTSASGGSWTQTQSAQDALFTVDGTSVSSSSNSSKTAIAGVTLNLTAAALGTTSSSGVTTGNSQTLTIASDTTSQTTAITNFVSLYNTLVTTMGTLTSFDGTQAQGQQAGPLLGDSMANTIQNSLASIVSGGVNSGNTSLSLSSIGITLNADGTLTADNTAVTAALTNSPSTVAALFNSTTGIAAKLNTSVTNFTEPGGIMDTETTSINADLKSIAAQQTTLSDYTTQLTNQYQAQFTALNTLMATMNNNSQYLTQLFGGSNSAGALANGKS